MCWVVLLLAVTCLAGAPPTAEFPQGTMVGTRITTRGGRDIQAYLGIPYAAPPLGPLRFKPPQPPACWEGVFDATKEAEGCTQAILPHGKEDCLYLNVYSPNATHQLNFAVMVFIYGGAFETGSSSSTMYGPQYFLDEDIILVTLNYRLGYLGFLSLEHPILSGNMGLKDQRAALRWVRNNIIYFGGDPRRITIFGQSAGSASVHYQMKYSSHEGLFRAAILQSGSTFDCWAFQPPGSQEPYVKHIANVTGCEQTDISEFVECLRQVPAETYMLDLTVITLGPDPLVRKVTSLPPMIEPPGSEEPFVTADPWTVPTSVPLMAGVMEKECLALNIPPVFAADPTGIMYQRYDENYTYYLPINLQYEDTAEDPTLVTNLIKEFYLGNDHFAPENYETIVNLFSDGTIINGVFRAARSNRQKTYFYYFSYTGLYSVSYLEGNLERTGAAHADDLFFFFQVDFPPDIVPSDLALSKKLIKMWTNFAKHLDPTPDNDLGVKWDPITTPNIEYLHIGQTNLTMENDFLKSRMDFWDELPFRNKPFEFKWPYTFSRALSPIQISEKYLRNRLAKQYQEEFIWEGN